MATTKKRLTTRKRATKPSREQMLLSIMGGATLPSPDTTELFERARAQFGPRQSEPEPRDRVLLVRLRKGRRPVVGAHVEWQRGEETRLRSSSPRHERTDRLGGALALFEPGKLHGVERGRPRVTLADGTKISFPPVDLNRSGEQRVSSDEGFVLSVRPARRQLDTSGTRSRRKKITPVAVGLCATGAQLEQVLPHLSSMPCLSLRAVFLAGRKSKRPPRLPRGAKLHTVGRDMADSLANIRLLFDLSGHRQIQTLHRRQIMGVRESGAIIVPLEGHPLDRVGAMIERALEQMAGGGY